MAISLNKPSAGVGLRRVGASLKIPSGDGSHSARLTIILHDDHGRDRAVIDHRNARSSDGAVALTTSGADGEGVQVDLTQLRTSIDAVAICASLIGHQQPSSTAEGLLRLFDLDVGEEIGRYDLKEIGSRSAYEFGRFERVDGSWRFRSTGRDPGDAFERAVRRDPPIASQTAAGAPPPRPQTTTDGRPRDPQEAFRDAIAARGLAGYCDTAEREGLLRDGVKFGLDQTTAQALLDLTLERGGIANEAVLRERLDKVLRQFTDKDRKLDPKERSDALQMVCRPERGYTKGLRADVADRAVVDFCRARGVKVKSGWLGWKVP